MVFTVLVVGLTHRRMRFRFTDDDVSLAHLREAVAKRRIFTPCTRSVSFHAWHGELREGLLQEQGVNNYDEVYVTYVTIKIKGLFGSPIHVRTNPNDCLESIREALDGWWFDHRDARFVIDGTFRTVLPGESFITQGITNNSVLHMVLR